MIKYKPMSLSQNKGFSLVEIILVLGVIAILTGGVLYSFSSMSKRELLDSVVVETKKALIFAQESLRQGRYQDVLVSFDFKNQKFVLESKTDVSSPVGTQVEFIDYAEDGIIIRGRDKKSGQILEKITFEVVSEKLGELELKDVVVYSSTPIQKDDFSIDISFEKQGEERIMTIDKGKIIYGFEL